MPPLRRIGLLGDIHAEDEALAAALLHLAALGVDRVLAVGDVCDGPGDVDACVQLLIEHRVDVVRGNHDRWLAAGKMRHLEDATNARAIAPATRGFLATLPPTMRFDAVGGGLLLCHGLGDDDMARLGPTDHGYALDTNEELAALVRDPGLAFVVGGHTHRRMVRRFRRVNVDGPGLVVINAGTLYRRHAPCHGLVDLGEETVTYFEGPAHEPTVVAIPDVGDAALLP